MTSGAEEADVAALLAEVAAVVAEAEEAGRFGVYGPGATEASRASVELADVGRRPVVLGRAHGELAGVGVPAGLSPEAAAAAPAAAAAAPAVAAAGVTDEDPSVERAAASVTGEPCGASTAPDSIDVVASVLPGFPNAPVRAPAALAGPDFFRPRRSSSDFFGGVPAAGPSLLVASPLVASLLVSPRGGEVGAGPGWGDGTGEAEAADRGAEAAEPAETPDTELGPDAGPWSWPSDGDPLNGVADWAERAE